MLYRKRLKTSEHFARERPALATKRALCIESSLVCVPMRARGTAQRRHPIMRFQSAMFAAVAGA